MAFGYSRDDSGVFLPEAKADGVGRPVQQAQGVREAPSEDR